MVLDVAPSKVPICLTVGGMPKSHANDVVVSKSLLDCLGYCELRLFLRAVVGHKYCAYAKLKWVANLGLLGDIHFELLILL